MSSEAGRRTEAVRAEAENTEDVRAEAESAEDENAKGLAGVRVSSEAAGGAIGETYPREEKFTELEPPQVPKSWQLSRKEDWRKTVQLLLQLDRSQFVVSPGFGSLEEALESGPGLLDLFAGSRGLSRACCNLASTWSLTFDLAHSPKEDLLNSSLQRLLFKLGLLDLFARLFRRLSRRPAERFNIRRVRHGARLCSNTRTFWAIRC